MTGRFKQTWFFAIHLCYMRYPGIILGINDQPFLPSLLEIVANQLKISIDHWQTYGKREQTRREHLIELQTIFGFQIFSTSNHYPSSLSSLEELACQTDKGIVLAVALIENLPKQNILIPPIDTIERLCSEAIIRANRRIFKILTESLSTSHLQRLNNLLKCKDNSAVTWLMWLHQSPLKPNSRYMLEHIDRLKVWQDLDLPANLKSKVHQNRLLKIAREGKQMTSSNLSKLEHQRRYATLVALSIEGMATVIDEIIELHERIIGKLFSTAKHKHQEKFHSNGKAINDKLRLYSLIGQSLLEARENSKDPFQAIEVIISWDTFIESIKETHTLVQTESFDFLHHIKESYSTLRRYAPKFLDILILKAAPSAQPILDAIHVLKEMNTNNIRKVPNDISTGFVKPRWRTLVFTKDGIDRQYYELYLFVELKNSLRSGDIWVQGSRHFKDFNQYLIPLNTLEQIKTNDEFPLPVNVDFEKYMMERLFLLENQLEKVNYLASTNSLPDAIINTDGLKIIPLDANVPKAAQELIDHIAMMLPHVKITEILMEVDEWTNFTQHFIHLKSGNLVKDKEQLLTTVLADGINLGLHKMTQSCPGTTYPKLSWIQAWYIRDETYTAALAELTNKQIKEPFSDHWGKGLLRLLMDNVFALDPRLNILDISILNMGQNLVACFIHISLINIHLLILKSLM